MTVKERLLKFIGYLEINISKFEKECGLSNGYINNIRQSVGRETLKKIEERYPELNKMWLLHGQGKMITDEVSHETVNEPDQSYKTSVSRLLTMLEKEQDNVKNAHDIIRILAGKVKPETNDPPKEGFPPLRTAQPEN